MSEKTRTSLGITFQAILLALGMYFFCRVFRNNMYFELIGPLEESNPALHEGLRYLGHIIMLAGVLVYFALVKEERHCLKSAEFTRNNKAVLFLMVGLVSGFAMNGASILTAILHGDIDMVGQSFNPAMLIFIFFCVFIQSSTEEFQFRLWAYNRIANKTTLGYAVIGSSLAFSLSHMLNNGISFVALLNIGLIGVLYALSMKCTGSVWFACGNHAAWNFTQNCIFGLPNSGHPAVISMMAPTFTKESFFYDPVFGVEGTLISTIITLIPMAIMIIIIRKKH